MTTCASLSRLPCDTCGETTLHAENVCVHCGTMHAFMRFYDDPKKALEFSLKQQSRRRGGKKSVRPKHDWNPPKPKVRKGGRREGHDVAERARDLVSGRVR